jgi:hypothetical protein
MITGVKSNLLVLGQTFVHENFHAVKISERWHSLRSVVQLEEKRMLMVRTTGKQARERQVTEWPIMGTVSVSYQQFRIKRNFKKQKNQRTLAIIIAWAA